MSIIIEEIETEFQELFVQISSETTLHETIASKSFVDPTNIDR